MDCCKTSEQYELDPERREACIYSIPLGRCAHAGGACRNCPDRVTLSTKMSNAEGRREELLKQVVANINKGCSCPLCHQKFSTADGVTPAEHLAKGILDLFSEMQKRENNLPCPRCGKDSMTERNALSRQADVDVCDSCGIEEALLASNGEVFPLESWWIVVGLLIRRSEQEQET